jgi:flagellar protein FlbD
MIRLTRLNNQPLTVNSDLIKFIEQSPDTMLTLITGEKIVVRESIQDVLGRIVEFRRSVLQGLPPVWDAGSRIPLDDSAGAPDDRKPDRKSNR